jgi:hypothetical protein
MLMLFSNRNERSGLLISAVLFALIGIVQLGRALMNVPVTIGHSAIPAWVSLLIGLVSLGMAFWMGMLLKHRRPLI